MTNETLTQYQARALTHSETNALLTAASANDSAVILQEKTNSNTSELWSQPLPLRKGTYADFQETVGLRVWVNNSNYSREMSREEKLANGCYCIVLEFDADAEGNEIPLEQQIAWVKASGIPVSYALWTGGKSIHFWVLIDKGVKVPHDGWQMLANGLMHEVNKAAAGAAKADCSTIVALHSWRYPCSVHEKTGNQGLMLEALSSTRAYKLTELQKYYKILSNKRSASSNTARVDEGCDTVQELQERVQQYLSKFRPISDKNKATLEQKITKELAEVKRGAGKGAATAIWAIANKYASIVTYYPNPIECLRWFIAAASPTLDAQDKARGKAWDLGEVERAVVRGLSSGLAHRETVGTDTTREFTGDVMEKQYVSEILEQVSTQEKIVFIRSNTGTGKTRAIKQRLADLPSDARVLFLCHRTALVDQWVAEDNTITDYRNVGITEDISEKKRLAICVDSLHKLAKSASRNRNKRANVRYDLIVLDECDQLLQHLLLSIGTDVKNSRLLTLKILRAILYKSTQTIAASAHLSNLEVDIVRQLAKGDSEEEVNATAIVNTIKPKQRKYVFLSSEAEAYGMVKEMLERGERVFICCDSKEKAHAIYSDLKNTYRDKLGKVISSETIAANSAAMRTLSDFVSQLDYLVASPSLGTGYDINNSHFHSVVGIFTNTRDLGFYDLEQALARVRYPISDVSYVYVSPISNYQPTELEFLKSLWRVDEQALEKSTEDIVDFSCNGEAKVDYMSSQIAEWQGLYIARKVTESIQREAKLITVLGERGHVVTKNATPVRQEKIDTGFYKKQKADGIFAALDITEEEYQGLLNKYYRNQEHLTEQEQLSVSKHRIKRFFGGAALEESDVTWWVKVGVKCERFQKLHSMSEAEAVARDRAEVRNTGMNGGYGASFWYKNRQVVLTLADMIDSIANLKHYTDATSEVKELADYAKENQAAMKQLGVEYKPKYSCRMVSELGELMFLTNERGKVKVAGEDKRKDVNKLVRTTEDQARYECYLDSKQALEEQELQDELEGVC